MKKDQYYLDHSLGYKLFHSSRLMNSRLIRNFKVNGFDLTYEQWQILSRLYEKDGQTQNELAIQNERDQASVSRLIDNMLKRNLVTRVPQKKDRRVNYIYLTDEAKRIRQELEDSAQKTIRQASEEISPEDLAVTLRTLDKIRKNLQ
ncbi:MarR family winged helix-turn-helix transcriptional regulator [Jeotgalibacillus proteolyticus]|uniref:MarR family transcriptional regulator n=1 Tax=Jeotgalibacillus proteolyticus TaxID=2082395 RepID=A0A2S5GDB9_9BACL|nr:MarR family transcriptional regulator [Jeotgalibacillus proteolyticus]PPA70904.1 MarR family transcriptional regulator [Jeotgalibacillus proteolyticus]